MQHWFFSLTGEERKKMMKDARTEGKELRRKHMRKDKEAVMESLHKLKLLPRPQALGVPLRKDQMIAVACEDNWYPGEFKLLPTRL